MKQYSAEFFGTFWLVLGGCGSAVSLDFRALELVSWALRSHSV